MLPTFAMAQVETLRTCLEIEDQSKERLNCYDEKIKPEPNGQECERLPLFKGGVGF
jgi:hypothetical protein